MDTIDINLSTIWTCARDTVSRAQAESDCSANRLIILTESTSSNRQCQKPVSTVRSWCCEKRSLLVLVWQVGFDNGFVAQNSSSVPKWLFTWKRLVGGGLPNIANQRDKYAAMWESGWRATFDKMIPCRGREPAAETKKAGSACEDTLRMPKPPSRIASPDWIHLLSGREQFVILLTADLSTVKRVYSFVLH